MSIDFRTLSAIQHPDIRRTSVADAFAREPYICLSDALVSQSVASQILMVMLAEEARTGMIDPATHRRSPALRRTWRIRALRDQWGRPYSPCDVIEWKAGIVHRLPNGRKVTSRIRQEYRRQGIEDEIMITHAAQLDADCCFSVEFEDASNLLFNYGVHPRTGLPVCKKREMSNRPVPSPHGMTHRHNWRFVEVPPDMAPLECGRPAKGPRHLVSVPGDPVAVVPAAVEPAPVAAVEPEPAPKRRGRKPKAKPAVMPEPVEPTPTE